MKSVVRLSEQKRLNGRGTFDEGKDFEIDQHGSQKILSQELWRLLSSNVLSPSHQYGLGVFEGVMAYRAKNENENYKMFIFRLSDHIERLFRSTEQMHTTISHTREQIRDAIVRAVEQHINSPKVYVRPTDWTDRKNYNIAVDKTPFTEFLVEAEPFSYLNNDLKLLMLTDGELQRLDARAGDINAKITGQYANSAKAKRLAIQAGYNDTILLHDDFVAELSGANLLFVNENGVFTPRSDYVFGGLTRDSITKILLWEKGIKVQETDISSKDLLHRFNGGFAVGSAAEVKKIGQINDTPFGVESNGLYGELAKFLPQVYADITQGNTQKYQGHQEYQKWLESN